MKERPNVLVLFTDDQRFDTIACLGDYPVKTPHMDRLVREGTAFTHACIPGGTSGAVCMPSRAMLHTGRSLFHLEGVGETIPSGHTMMGETFQEAGYRTFGSGKWHNGRASFARSFKNGDEIFFGGMADHWNVPMYHFDPTGQYDEIRLEIPNPMACNETRARECDHIHIGEHSSEIIAAAGVRFLRERLTSEPFFLYLSFLAPHDPRSMPKEYLNLYDPDEIELPPNFLPVHPFDNGELAVRDELLAGFPRTEAETRRHIAEYYAMITHLDAQIERVLGALDESGVMDNTIIVLAGDNGLALGQHGLFGKQSCYDHSVRVPLVFRGPGVPEGVRSQANVYLYDIFPTLCELTGTRAPMTVDGQSVVCAMDDSEDMVRDAMYYAYTDKHRAVKWGTWKLIEYVVEGKHSGTQLFNLEEDPWESFNLAPLAAHAETLTQMRQRLRELAVKYDDEQSPWGTRFWRGMRA